MYAYIYWNMYWKDLNVLKIPVFNIFFKETWNFEKICDRLCAMFENIYLILFKKTGLLNKLCCLRINLIYINPLNAKDPIEVKWFFFSQNILKLFKKYFL